MKKYEIEINNEIYRVSVKELPADTDMTSSETGPAVATQPATVTAESAPATKAATQTLSPTPTQALSPTPTQTPTQNRPTQVKAPMAGTIFKVPVTSGQAVAKGDTLIILEAMKMENEIVAPIDGIVGEIYVRPNDAVQSDQLLLTI